MNNIKKLFNDISDSELQKAVNEIRLSEISGTIEADSVVRKYCQLTSEITNGFTLTDFTMVQMNLLKEAAFRWLDNQEKNKSGNTWMESLGL